MKMDVMSRRNGNYKFLLAASLIAALVSCGAPMKSADDVGSIFSDSSSLKSKVSDFCKVLNGRTVDPNLTNIGLADSLCANAGDKYRNYDEIRGEGFLPFSEEKATGATTSLTDANVETIGFQTRSELFLNRSLLELAQKVFSSLDQKSNDVFKNGGNADAKDNALSLKIINKPQFNKDTYEFSMEFQLISTRQQNGLVDVNNNYVVNGKVFDRKIAVSIKTTKPGDVKETIVREGKILIVMIPHAGDIYMDIATDIKYHAFGIDKVFQENVKKTLSKGLRNIPEIVTDVK